MEFDYIGKHCSLPTCNQKDFLPFKCDYCHKDFCLDHRSYACHGCDGALSKDVTSTDCPMCGKSIKFTKAQDPNVIWEEHYLNGCTQTAQRKQTKKCGKSGCTTTLGPTNTFTCSKCRQEVCIAHRLPEDHNCAAALRQLRADALQAKMGPVQKKAPSSSTIGAMKATELKNENSLKGSAARRMPTNPATTPSSSSGARPTVANSSSLPGSRANPVTIDESTTADHVCPFLCGASFSNATELTNHINAAHNESTSQPQVTNNIGSEQVGIIGMIASIFPRNDVCFSF